MNFYSIHLTTFMLTSYNKYRGTVTNTNVIRSGGVITAATIIMVRNACLRYADSMLPVIILILASTNAMMGSWNTTPISSVSVVNVDT